MGLFENLGRKVEEFKQQATEEAREKAERECADCGELIYTDREDCPECGSERIVSRKPEGENSTGSDSSVDPSDSTESTDSDESPTTDEPSTTDESADSDDSDGSSEASTSGASGKPDESGD